MAPRQHTSLLMQELVFTTTSSGFSVLADSIIPVTKHTVKEFKRAYILNPRRTKATCFVSGASSSQCARNSWSCGGETQCDGIISSLVIRNIFGNTVPSWYR